MWGVCKRECVYICVVCRRKEETTDKETNAKRKD